MDHDPVKTVKYCYWCHREDMHARLRVQPRWKYVMSVATLGLANPLWPCRCMTCGHRRPLNDGAAALLARLNPP